MKIYFFPGLGADASLAKFHQLPGHDVVWVNWPNKIFDDWQRFDEDILIENKIEPGAAFVGISFGGMVAQRIARFKNPKCIILIGSLTKPGSVSLLLRAFKPVTRFLPLFLFNMNLLPKVLAGWFFGITKPEDIALLYEMGRKLKPMEFKCLNLLALDFKINHDLAIPLFRIHGASDRIIPARSEKREKIIPDGGHLISLTHSGEINSSIFGWVEEAGNGARKAT